MPSRNSRPAYEEWIARERRIRLRLLKNSPQIQATQVYRVCRDCQEICLCHEETCPHCLSVNITEKKLAVFDDETLAQRIRCQGRYEKL